MAPPPAQLLSGIRLGVGTGAWLAPELTGKLFGLDPARNPQMALMARLFGVRDVALAAATSATPPPRARCSGRSGIACDLLDAGAAYLAARNGTVPKPAATMILVTALTAAGLGVAAMQAD